MRSPSVAKGTPRIALRLLQSARRVPGSRGSRVLTVAHLQRACEIERISDLGLDNMQQKYLALLAGGPQRLNVLASMLGVSTKVLTKTVEPSLLRLGLVVKDDGGRRNLTEIGHDPPVQFAFGKWVKRVRNCAGLCPETA